MLGSRSAGIAVGNDFASIRIVGDFGPTATPLSMRKALAHRLAVGTDMAISGICICWQGLPR